MNSISSPALTLPLPDFSNNNKAVTLSTQCRAALNVAFAHLFNEGGELKPGAAIPAVDYSDWKIAKIILFAPQIAKLEVIGNFLGVSIREAFARVVTVGRNITAEREKSLQPKIDAQAQKSYKLPFDPRCSEQSDFFCNIMRGLESAKVCMAEGSTGIGKGRAMTAAAAKMTREGRGLVVIASPTIVLTAQIYKEYKAMPEELRGSLVASILPGAPDFVADTLLADDLDEIIKEDPEIASPVVAWVKAGGPTHLESGLITSMRDCGIEPRWLMADLQKISPKFDWEKYRLTETEKPDRPAEGSAWDVVGKIRKVAKQTNILFVSHAMLVVGMRTNWNLFPKPSQLIIDEAHSFEEAVSMVYTNDLSLLSLRVTLGRLAEMHTRGAKSALKLAIKFTTRLRELDEDEDNKITLISPAFRHSAAQRVGEDIDALVRALPQTPGGGTLGYRLSKARNVLQTIAKPLAVATEGRADQRVELLFSPDRRFPSLRTSANDLSLPMRTLWKAAENGVVLASATLFTVNADGDRRCDYVSSKLFVAKERIYTPKPLVAPHILSTPTMMVPTLGTAKMLIPTSDNKTKEEKKAYEAWILALAQCCKEATQTAAGGTLILCTSYQQIHSLYDQVVALGVAQDRIVKSKRGLAFSSYIEDFKQKYEDGRRPIWFALGPAWTGLSLTLGDEKENEVAAEDDFLLTDLVVSRLPIGLNRSMAMTARLERYHTLYPIAQETLLTFKQGLGRLIRRKDVKKRRIWVMDGRIWAPGGIKIPGLAQSCERILKDYPRQNWKTFRINPESSI